MYKVIGAPEFNAQYDALKESAEGGNGASQILLKKLDKAIAKLKFNFRAGQHISREKIPRYYRAKYGVENLWRLEIDRNWRLVYTIRGTEVEVMSVLLEFLPHKDYNKRFGYRG